MSGQISLLEDDDRHQFKQARKSILINNFDSSAYPPDLEFSQQHGISQKVGKEIGALQDVQRCRCCLEPIYKQQLPLLCDLDDLSHCGESTPMYFVFVKQLLIVLFFNIIFLTFPLTIVNLTQGSQCSAVDGSNHISFFSTICSASVINIMNIEEINNMQIEAIIIFIVIILNVFLIAYLEIRMEENCQRFLKYPKSSNYSFMLKGLPKDITITEMQKYVEDNLLFSGAPDTTIIKIYLIYDFKTYLVLYQKKRQCIQRIIQLKFQLDKINQKNLITQDYEKKIKLQEKQKNCIQEISENQDKLQHIEIQIYKYQCKTNQIATKLKNEGVLENQFDDNIIRFSGKCIVTLNNKKSRDKIISIKGKNGIFQKMAMGLSEFLQGSKSTLAITSAPQPDDIIFSNMGSKKIIVWRTRILYSLLIFVLVLIDFVLIAFTKKFLKEQKAIQSGNLIFSFINSIVISIFCSIFRRIIRASESQSFYNTQSKLSYEIVSKLVLIFMINMLFTTFVANVVSFYLIKQDQATFDAFPLNFQSFLFDVFFLIITNPLFSLTLMIFDHRHYRGLFRRWLIRTHRIAVSQAEANLAFENMNFDICHKYGTAYRFFLFTGGIAIIYPPSLIICFVALGLIYWFDKILLLRRYSITVKLCVRFTLMAQKLMWQFPIYISLANLLVMFIPIQSGKAFQDGKYSKVYYYLAVIAVIFTFSAYFFGNQLIKFVIKKILRKKEQAEETQEILYKDIENILKIDYSHNYPYFRVNKKIGLDQPLDSIRRQKLKELRENEKIGVFGVLKSYMHQIRYK